MTGPTPLTLLRVLGAALLAMLVFASPATAQDDDELGSYIHEETCDSLGNEVEEIEDLELNHHNDDDDDDDDDRRDHDRIWQRIGGEDTQPERLWAEDDDVDMSLQELMDGEFVITVHEADDNDSAVIVCGAITGEPDQDGGLLIDLEEAEDSGFEGRAYLVPDNDDDDDDDDDTDVYIGVWEVQPAGA